MAEQARQQCLSVISASVPVSRFPALSSCHCLARLQTVTWAKRTLFSSKLFLVSVLPHKKKTHKKKTYLKNQAVICVILCQMLKICPGYKVKCDYHHRKPDMETCTYCFSTEWLRQEDCIQCKSSLTV